MSYLVSCRHIQWARSTLTGVDAGTAGKNGSEDGEARGDEADKGKGNTGGFGLVILGLHAEGYGSAGGLGGNWGADAGGQGGRSAEHHALHRRGSEGVGLLSDIYPYTSHKGISLYQSQRQESAQRTRHADVKTGAQR